MATSIVGTFPILTHTKSQTDEYGFDYVNYQYTVKTSELRSYSVKKDDKFYGFNSLGTAVSINTLSTGSTYVVENVETKNTAGGLTDITINTVGSKNSAESNSPRIVVLSGGPLIFGLSGTPPIGSVYGYGFASGGQSVEIKFLAEGGTLGQQQNFNTYLAALMPATFRGISLPIAAKGPHSFSNVGTTGPNDLPYGEEGYYYGFVCKTILTEKRGSLLLVTLVFSEAGKALRWSITGANTASGAYFYDFPTIG